MYGVASEEQKMMKEFNEIVTWNGGCTVLGMPVVRKESGDGVGVEVMPWWLHCVCAIDTLPGCHAISPPQYPDDIHHTLAITVGLSTVQCVFTYMSKEFIYCKDRTTSVSSVSSVTMPQHLDNICHIRLCKSGNCWPIGGGGGILWPMVAPGVGQCALLTHIHFHNNISVSTSWTTGQYKGIISNSQIPNASTEHQLSCWQI